MVERPATVLVPGVGVGPALVIEPLSFWGGCDPETGEIIDPHHPSRGGSVTGRCLVMAHGSGSSSSATVLAETLHNRVGPVAIVLEQVDGIIVLGAAVADELYGEGCPVVMLPGATRLIADGAHVEVSQDGRISAS